MAGHLVALIECEHLLGLDALRVVKDAAVQVEGAFDALSIIEAGGEAVSREEILERVWHGEADGGIVNVYIHYLREKLESGGERQQLSLEFIRHLLTPECQAELKRINAFTVLDGLTGYSSAHPLAQMDHALLNNELEVSPAFNISSEQTARTARQNVRVYDFSENAFFNAIYNR